MENNILYLDCNRQFSRIKEDEYKNDWTNEFNTIAIPSGSKIEIQNAMINIQGIEGGSIEIREDKTLNLKASCYISHSDYQTPKYNYADTTVYTVANDAFRKHTSLNSLFMNYFTDHNTDLLWSTTMGIKLGQDITMANTQTTQLTFSPDAIFFDTQLFGGTEQPLYPIFIDDNGKVKPVLENIIINIPRGIYGISQLSEFITNQLNGEPFDLNYDKNREVIDIVKLYNEEAYEGQLNSQCTRRCYLWDYEYEVAGVDYIELSDILNNMVVHELTTLKSITQGGTYLYVGCTDYNALMEAWRESDEDGPVSADFDAAAYLSSHYIAAFKKLSQQDLVPRNDNDYAYFQSGDANINYAGLNLPQDYWNYNPLYYGFQLGANPQFTYDSVNAGFSFTYLHTSRVEASHDLIGNVLANEGKNVSYYKEAGMIVNILDEPALSLSDKEKLQIKSSVLYPKQRSTGISIYNWDFDVAVANSNIPNINKTDDKYDYYRFEDFLTNGKQNQKNAWAKSFWYTLGFDLDQLGEASYEIVNSYDLPQSKMYGTATNNVIDTSILPSIAQQYCPAQGTNSGDYINAETPHLLPQVLRSQLRVYDPLYPSKTQLGFYKYNQKTWNVIRNVYTQNFSVLTDSKDITGNRLPQLSDEGYFIITSDIIGAMGDVVKNNMPLPLLGVIPKSNLSNQDYINSFQDIEHITSQDIVVNAIRFRILNADLTLPYLNDKSTIILKITLNNKKEPQTKSNSNKITTTI